VKHLRTYLPEEETAKVLRCHQREIARFIQAQMQGHCWEKVVEHEVVVKQGFSDMKACAYSATANESPIDFRQAPADKSNMARYLFGGFSKCLYPVEKFQSDPERKLAVILEREAIKWFRPPKGQFQIIYRWQTEHREYQPDFVAETKDVIYMLEPKRRDQVADPEVVAKKDVAVKWCKHASDHAKTYSGKPWKYVLIPHDEIAENMTLVGLAQRFSKE